MTAWLSSIRNPKSAAPQFLLYRYGERALALAARVFVGEPRLPLAGHLNLYLRAIDAGLVRRRERGRVVHRGHRAHRGHVEVERSRAHVHGLARRVLEGDREFR